MIASLGIIPLHFESRGVYKQTAWLTIVKRNIVFMLNFLEQFDYRVYNDAVWDLLKD